jgi:hypothetical protein
MAGAALYLGYGARRAQLLFVFGYSGPFLSLFGHEELLMAGVTIMFNLIAPNLLIACALAGPLVWKLSDRALARLCWVAAGAAALVAVTFTSVIARYPTPLTWLIVRGPYFICAYAFLLALITMARIKHVPAVKGPSWLRAAVIALGWAFLLWITPWLVPPGHSCFPTVRLHRRDGSVRDYRLVSRHEGVWIVGAAPDEPDLGLRFIPENDIATAVVGGCKEIGLSGAAQAVRPSSPQVQ